MFQQFRARDDLIDRKAGNNNCAKTVWLEAVSPDEARTIITVRKELKVRVCKTRNIFISRIENLTPRQTTVMKLTNENKECEVNYLKNAPSHAIIHDHIDFNKRK
jgi:hypothetical protein